MKNMKHVSILWSVLGRQPAGTEYYPLSFAYSYLSLWPWAYFKVTVVPNSFNWKFSVIFHLVETLYGCSLCQQVHEYTTLFLFSQIFKGDNWDSSSLEKICKRAGLFSDTVEVRSFKLCLIIILLGYNIKSYQVWWPCFKVTGVDGWDLSGHSWISVFR